MEESKSACVVLVVVFLALIFAEPVVQAVNDLRAGEAPTVLDVFRRTPTRGHLRAYEDSLRELSAVGEVVRPWMQYWRYRVMSDAGKNGIVGRDGWLFYKPGVRFLVEPWPMRNQADDPAAAIVSFRDQLDARGIRLLVLVAPGKESVYPTQLVGGADSLVNGHVEAFIETMSTHNIDMLYAEPAKNNNDGGPEGKGDYLAQDTHWTPARAAAVAEQVAKFIADKGWLQRGTASYGVKDVFIERHGDILRMAKSEPLLRAHAPETIACEQVIDRATGNPYQDDSESPVLVLGDSFLRIFQSDEPESAGFIAHLARALKLPVSSIVNDGGASTLVRQELRRKPELLDGKKVVIWEFVDRDLRFGTDGWKIVELAGTS